MVAPTDFIMLISRRRLYIVTRMVLLMINRETTLRMIKIQRPAVPTILFRFVSLEAASLRSLRVSTWGISLILATVSS